MFVLDRAAHRVVAALVCLLASTLQATDDVPRDSTTELERVEIYFELKFLYRGRQMLTRLAIDQWAGGRLLMQAEPIAGPVSGMRLQLVRPIEHPWTFRWYPTKNEAKLGAAVWVGQPSGDPYGTLAALLEPLARERYRLWWKDDRVTATAPAQPGWVSRTERFWAAQHRRERGSKDALHEDPVYPFHVLGDPHGRFGAVIGADGRLDPESILERMSEPWLADGWADALEGKPVSGYGYWGSERPSWEPRTYQVFAEALRLLSWSAFDNGSPEATAALGRGALYRRNAGQGAEDPLRVLADVVKSLVPRTRGRFDWSGSPTIGFSVVESSPTHISVTGDSGDQPLDNQPRVRYRLWRHARHDRLRERMERDEVQVLLAHRDQRSVKLWVKIGLRPAD